MKKFSAYGLDGSIFDFIADVLSIFFLNQWKEIP